MSFKTYLVAGFPCWWCCCGCGWWGGLIMGCWITAGLLPVREWFGTIDDVDVADDNDDC